MPLVSSLLDSLAARGHAVEVVTGFPNYPQGRLYDGYRSRLRQVEDQGGVRVVRTPLLPSHDTSGLHRTANYLSFALSSSTIGLASTGRPDVAYVYHPPITAAWGARLLHRLRGVPFVLHVQDLWPDAVTSSGMLGDQSAPGFAARRLAAMVARTYRSAAHLAVISEGFASLLAARGVPERKITVIRNWSPVVPTDSGVLEPGVREALGPPGARILLFAGNIGPFQNLDAVLRQVAALPAGSRLHLAIMGDGISRPALESLAASLGTTRVTFLDPCEPSAALRFQLAADALLVPLGAGGFLGATIPSKLATALALGRPVLVAAEGDAVDLVDAAGAGLTCAPGEQALAGALARLEGLEDGALAAMGESGRRYYADQLDLENAVGRFEQVFDAVAR